MQVSYFNNIYIFNGETGGFPTLKSITEKMHCFSGTTLMQTMWSGLESSNFGRMEVVSRS